METAHRPEIMMQAGFTAPASSVRKEPRRTACLACDRTSLDLLFSIMMVSLLIVETPVAAAAALSNSELRDLVQECSVEGWTSSASGDPCDRMLMADTSAVTDMSGLFYGRFAISFNGDLSRWDTGSVTDMSQMFRDASSFNGDVTSWQTSRVVSMASMFEFAMSFNQPLSRWNVSAVTDLSYIFLYATTFNQDLSAWDTRSVTSLLSTFARAPSFNGDLSTWSTSKVTNMHGCFADATAFNADVSRWDVSAAIDIRYMFNGASEFNQDLSRWNTGSVTDMSNMFASASSFNCNISLWDVSKVTSMWNLFSGASAFYSDVSRWDTSSVTDMRQVFAGASSFNGAVSGWDTSAVSSMAQMFSSASTFNDDISAWNTSRVADMSHMFADATAFNADIAAWDTSAVTSMDSMFQGASAFSRDMCPWNLQGRSNEVSLDSVFDGSPLASVAFGCEPSCNDGALNNNEEPTDCGGDNNCVGGCVVATCSDGILNQDESMIDCGGQRCAVCGHSSTPSQPSSTSTSYGVSVSSALAACPPSLAGGGHCWQITVALSGAPPALSARVLLVYANTDGDRKRFPCSLEDSKCECLDRITSDGLYFATSLPSGSESPCGGGQYNSSKLPMVSSTMYGADGAIMSGIQVNPTESSYTILISTATLTSIPGAVSRIDGGLAWRLVVGFAEMLPVGSLDVFDAVSHERALTLQQRSFAFFSSVSSLETSSSRFAHARAHKVLDAYYVAVSFVISSTPVAGLEIPTSSIMVKRGSSGSEIGIACHPNGSFVGNPEDFNAPCGPFPDLTSPPFCRGALHASGSNGVASLYIPLTSPIDADRLVVEFRVMTAAASLRPSVETVSVTIDNLGGGGDLVEWCAKASVSTADMLAQAELSVMMYSGVVLPGNDGLSTLGVLSGNHSVGPHTPFPSPKSSIMDGIVTVAAQSRFADEARNLSVQLVKLAAVYVDEPGLKIGDHVNLPEPRFSAANGDLELDTASVCQDTARCSVKELVVSDAVQGDPQSSGYSPYVLAIDATTEADAAAWLQAATVSDTPFVASVGSHFHRQLTASVHSRTFCVNPRKPSDAPTATAESVSTAMVVLALWEVSIQSASGQRRRRRLLQRSTSSADASLASAVVRLDVSPASMAASTNGVPVDHVSAWRFRMAIAPLEACLAPQELSRRSRSRMLEALASSASVVLAVEVTSISVDSAGVDCGHGRRRRTLAESAPSVLLEALIVFEEDAAGSQPFVNVDKLEAVPAILWAAPSALGAAVQLLHGEQLPEHEETSEEDQKGARSPASSMALVAAGFAVGAVVAACAVVWACRPRCCTIASQTAVATGSVVLSSEDGATSSTMVASTLGGCRLEDSRAQGEPVDCTAVAIEEGMLVAV